MDQSDICIVGAGVVGLAIARQLAQSRYFSGRQIVLLEQHDDYGREVSSRNSEVIHAGLYYPQDSLKTRLCIRGRELLYDYCQRYQIPYRRIGKLIVAARAEESSLATLARQGEANGVQLHWLDANQLQSLEPAVTACHALLSPDTGIIDSHALMSSLLHQASSAGVDFVPNTEVTGVETCHNGFVVHTTNKGQTYRFHCDFLINSAGLQAQSLAEQISGTDKELIPPLYPCKGSYFSYRGKSPFSRLIYPLPAQHSLGIHATLDMAGQLRFGPDAEYVQTLDYGVDQELAGIFAEAIRSYFPQLQADRLCPDYAGIRPKLQAPGASFSDFCINDGRLQGIPGLIQLFGIESPGLTASLALAEHVEHLMCS
ncbi:MAG: NAD(P)/FAD-dependent oxidoreductase [Pseudomonadales bacterium]|nr:NAD(P)/FAD-dependent oxidoreductase [Pseudomonadales bacterium]